MSSNSNDDDSTSIICSVICECRDRLVEELSCDTVTQVLHTNGFITPEAYKAIKREKNKIARTMQLLSSLEKSRNDEALDVLIQHLRQDGTQPHLWTMLEYSRAKYRRIRASRTPISVALHM